ncbi:MAG: hypothetical protein QGF00_35860 [Planctomycetota bacterium]|nr:hypothetical protein [Planctomycetota bacterium]
MPDEIIAGKVGFGGLFERGKTRLHFWRQMLRASARAGSLAS